MGEDGVTISLGTNVIIDEANLTIAEHDGKITIGDRCLFAWGIDIRCGDGHPIFDMNSGKVINKAYNIIIEDKVWIALGVQILKNITNETSIVVGAKLLVTKDCPKKDCCRQPCENYTKKIRCE